MLSLFNLGEARSSALAVRGATRLQDLGRSLTASVSGARGTVAAPIANGATGQVAATYEMNSENVEGFMTTGDRQPRLGLLSERFRPPGRLLCLGPAPPPPTAAAALPSPSPRRAVPACCCLRAILVIILFLWTRMGPRTILSSCRSG